MVKVEASVDIDRPIEEVFAYVADPSRTPEWSSIALECTLEGGGLIGVGSHIKTVGKFLGRRLEATCEVTAFDAPRKFAMRAVSGPGRFEIERRLESVGEGTRYHSIQTAESGGLFKLADPVVAALMKRTVDADHQTLKALLEARVTTPA